VNFFILNFPQLAQIINFFLQNNVKLFRKSGVLDSSIFWVKVENELIFYEVYRWNTSLLGSLYRSLGIL